VWGEMSCGERLFEVDIILLLLLSVRDNIYKQLLYIYISILKINNIKIYLKSLGSTGRLPASTPLLS